MSSKVRYHRLSQSMESDEEEDDGADEEDEDEGFEENILFDSRLTNTPVMERGEVFELERLGHPRVMGRSRDRYMEARKKRICLIVLVVFSICLIVSAAVLFPILNHAVNHGLVHHIDNMSGSSEDWIRNFNDTWCESSIRMLDIDKDGLDDVVVAVAKQVHIRAALEGKDMRAHCKDLGSTYPCGGELLALRGQDGAQLWSCHSRSSILYSACADLDVNGDGQTDCIVSGRHSTLQAVDVMSGKVLWSVDPEKPQWSTHFIPIWTVHQASSLPDLDGDDVLDLVVSHGEDVSEQSNSQAAGRLILISGKSGKPIGNSYLEIPGGVGTSTSPVKYVTDSGAVYILFGSGSKRKSGTLMSISLPDLFKRSTGKSLEHYNEDLYQWINSQVLDANGVAFLTSGSAKGILSPPILVDADSDGMFDILVTEYGGRVTLMDGPTLLKKWSRSFDGSEIHGSPTPGHFNTDLYLDYLIHVNVGAWDSYNLSRTLILNGADGSTLWSVEGSSNVHSSDLSLRTSADNISAFLIKLVGRNMSLDALSPNPGLDIMSRYFPRNPAGFAGFPANLSAGFPANLSAEEFQRKCELIDAGTLSDQATCDQNLDSLKVEVLLFDHSTSARPMKVLEVKAKRTHYLLDHSRGDPHCHALMARSRSKIGMCAVLTPTMSSGAVGDADGDSSLDYVHITQMAGPKRGDTGQVLDVFSSVSITKLSLGARLAQPSTVHLSPTYGQGGTNDRYTHRKGSEHSADFANDDGVTITRHFEKMHFLPAALQPWAQSLGSRGVALYDKPPS